MIAADELQQFLTSILPNSEVVVTQEEMEPPERLSAIWVRLMRTVDPDWPCMLGCFAFPDPSPLGERPDLRIAEYLAVRFGVKSLCDLGGLMPDLDPHDPYWSLAFADGAWHLADTSGTPLMGPYTDGKTSFPGDEKVRLKQKLEL
ncbi:MAG: hypothetical protein K8U57_28835 [Planctomycetes bacterium]|nr:hypothetical protein [Planctomycetota bacterium]